MRDNGVLLKMRKEQQPRCIYVCVAACHDKRDRQYFNSRLCCWLVLVHVCRVVRPSVHYSIHYSIHPLFQSFIHPHHSFIHSYSRLSACLSVLPNVLSDQFSRVNLITHNPIQTLNFKSHISIRKNKIEDWSGPDHTRYGCG